MLRFLRRTVPAALAVSLVTLGIVATPAVAQTLICSGVTRAEVAKCDPVSGYADAMALSHWGMYKGHNCTNFGAYRLIKNGVARPSYNLGNADTWATRAKAHGIRVDTKPVAGSIGVWPGKNHLVYVELVGNGYLITSEDNYPGYYPKGKYRKVKVVPGESAYPKQFIHFRDQLQSLVPKVTGTAKVGSSVTATAGNWVPTGVTFAYQWLRGGVPIVGATSPKYAFVAEDVRHRISVRVTGSKTGFSTKAVTSAQTVAVALGTIANSVAPTATGLAKVGSALTASEGTWTPSGIAYAYQWYAGGIAIDGATARSFVPTAAQLAKTMTVRVTSTKAGYATLAEYSAPTAPVAQGALVNTVAPTVSGTALVGITLRATAGTWTPTGVAFSYQWLRSGVPIAKATGSSYLLTAADRGTTVAVEVTGSKAGYTNLKATSKATAVVKTPATVSVAATPGNGRVTFAITVKASGVVPTGKVTIKDGTVLLKTVYLKSGKASVTLTGLKRGTHTFRINYLGDANVMHRAVSKSVNIS